ncbi:MAG: hypothetical protein K8S56_10110 [Candidatus Cloacimonetes bacterium]|nr:hypothetical protein [Candidatus Cloacimonadota bacterium]
MKRDAQGDAKDCGTIRILDSYGVHGICMKRLKRSVFCYILLWSLILIICACNPFSSRDSEDLGEAVQWNAYPINPYETLDNLEFAFEYTQNANRFNTILSENFTFYFDSQDVNEYGIPVISWNRATENDMLIFLQNHLAENAEIEVTLNSIDNEPDDLQSHFAEIYRTYEVAVSYNSGGYNTYQGKFYLYLEEISGFWKISLWFDYRTESDDPTWGMLKYDFAPI